MKSFLALAVACAVAIGGGCCRPAPNGETEPAPPAPAPAVAGNGSLEIKVTGLRGQDGRVLVALYRSADGFPGESDKAYRQGSEENSGTDVTFRFGDLPFGTYAASVLHDMNGNGTIDKNLFGIPTEGAGASNNPKPGFGPPRYEDARFELTEAAQALEITVRYP
jgi:uncharacterized protein (DUF2141 family)